MTKVTVLIPFRGSDFSEVYEKGQVYNLESARAQSLASRGLVRINPEEKTVVMHNETIEPAITDNTDKSESNVVISHNNRRGRKAKG